MTSPSGISRRLQQCLRHLEQKDWEGALVNLFPAIDKTAKRRRPKLGVGARIKAFLEDEEALIATVATGNQLTRILVNDVSIPDALYKFGRTSLLHEGELDPKLSFNSDGILEIGVDTWRLPSAYIVGMCVAVLAAPENKGEKVDDGGTFNLFGKSFAANDLWGERAQLEALMDQYFTPPGSRSD